MGSRTENRVRAVVVLAMLSSTLVPLSAAAQGRPRAVERPATRLEGRPIQAGLVVGHADRGSRVTLDRRRIRVARDGTFLVGFAMHAPETVVLSIVGPDGSREVKTFLIEQRRYATERIDDLPVDEVDLDRETQTSLRGAHRRIEAIRRRFTPEALFTGSFVWPAHGRVSTPFGVSRILNGEPRDTHDAIDIAVPVGTAVLAPAGAIVAFTSDEVPLAGRMVILDHGQGLTSTFLHLSEIRVHVGDRVEQGATLGLSGNTGRTTGAHLHWGVHLAGVPLDAELLVAPARP